MTRQASVYSNVIMTVAKLFMSTSLHKANNASHAATAVTNALVQRIRNATAEDTVR